MIDYLSDIAGIRIICSFTSDIYLIADMIAKQSDVTVLYVKDYIKNPKPNGYKSYHMVVTIPIYLSEGPVDTKVEIQIRTVAMDFWASLEHKIYYKFEGNAPDFLEKELKDCADMVDMLDAKMFSLNEAIMQHSAEERRKEAEAEERRIREEMAAREAGNREREAGKEAWEREEEERKAGDRENWASDSRISQTDREARHENCTSESVTCQRDSRRKGDRSHWAGISGAPWRFRHRHGRDCRQNGG